MLVKRSQMCLPRRQGMCMQMLTKKGEKHWVSIKLIAKHMENSSIRQWWLQKSCLHFVMQWCMKLMTHKNHQHYPCIVEMLPRNTTCPQVMQIHNIIIMFSVVFINTAHSHGSSIFTEVSGSIPLGWITLSVCGGGGLCAISIVCSVHSGSQESTVTATPYVETYAVVDRSRNKSKGTISTHF